MTDIDRFGIADVDEVTFTKAPLRTQKELDEAAKDVERMKKTMGVTHVNNSKEAL